MLSLLSLLFGPGGPSFAFFAKGGIRRCRTSNWHLVISQPEILGRRARTVKTKETIAMMAALRSQETNPKNNPERRVTHLSRCGLLAAHTLPDKSGEEVHLPLTIWLITPFFRKKESRAVV